MQYGTIVIKPHWLQFVIHDLPLILLCMGLLVYIGLDGTECCGVELLLLSLLSLILIYRLAWWLCMRYTVTDKLLIVRSGVFSVSTDYLELYRIIDIKKHEPFLLRLAGLKKVMVLSNDRTTPRLWIHGIDAGLPIEYVINERVRSCRRNNHVWEMANQY